MWADTDTNVDVLNYSDVRRHQSRATCLIHKLEIGLGQRLIDLHELVSQNLPDANSC